MKEETNLGTGHIDVRKLLGCVVLEWFSGGGLVERREEARWGQGRMKCAVVTPFHCGSSHGSDKGARATRDSERFLARKIAEYSLHDFCSGIFGYNPR